MSALSRASAALSTAPLTSSLTFWFLLLDFGSAQVCARCIFFLFLAILVVYMVEENFPVCHFLEYLHGTVTVHESFGDVAKIFFEIAEWLLVRESRGFAFQHAHTMRLLA